MIWDVDSIVYACRVMSFMLLLMPITNDILIKALFSSMTENDVSCKRIRGYLILVFLGIVFLFLSMLGVHINDVSISVKSYKIIGITSFFTALLYISLIGAITLIKVRMHIGCINYEKHLNKKV